MYDLPPPPKNVWDDTTPEQYRINLWHDDSDWVTMVTSVVVDGVVDDHLCHSHDGCISEEMIDSP